MVANNEVVISEAEAALYDRQIRLWGLDAQKRLRGSRVLLIGIGGLGAEIAKNLTLAGVRSLTILDDRTLKDDCVSANFLIPPNSSGKNVAEASYERVQRLNPMVEIITDTSSVSTKNEDYLKNFDVICATLLSMKELIRVNNICRSHGKKFYCGDIFGFTGYFFADLIDHEYSEEVNVPVTTKDGCSLPKIQKTEKVEIKTVKKIANYVPFQKAFNADYSKLNKKNWKRIQTHVVLMKCLMQFRSGAGRDPVLASQSSDLEKLMEIKAEVLADLKLNPDSVNDSIFSEVFGELSPTAAVVGGVLAQEIIKAVSHKDVPICNFFFFNGFTDRAGWVEAIGF